jgi:SAM-dependent methyltransferase
MTGNAAQLNRYVDAVLTAFSEVPVAGLGALVRVQAGLVALVALEEICSHLCDDPYPRLLRSFADIAELPRILGNVLPHIRLDGEDFPIPREGIAQTGSLFEAAWTQYDEKTYDHSLRLVEQRLRNSGYDETFFKGKTCFDGGCGTGRLSIAMAKAGAKEVVAADIGGESLEYLERVCRRYGLGNVRIVEQDVTRLENFETDRFDFVASNGVLHHTESPDRGIIEHFRITRPSGVFWIYLYGAGGIYWDTYDRLRPLTRDLEPRRIREILSTFNIRQGLVYTYLDNWLAPRVYYSLEQVLKLLRPHASFEYVHATGMSPIDDTKQLLATRWGAEIFGPDGEVRIAVTKTSPSNSKVFQDDSVRL